MARGLFRHPPQPQQPVVRVQPPPGIAAQAVTLSLLNPSYAAAVIADAPVAYWRLGEASGNPQDAIGTNHVTVIGGSPSYGVASSLGDGNTAMTFPAGSGLEVPDATALDVGDVFSIEFRVKRSAGSISDGLIHGIFNKQSTGGFAPELFINGGNTLVLWSGAVGNVQFGATITDTAWHHAVVTKSGSTIRWYLDGALTPDDPGTATTFSNTTNVLIIGAEGLTASSLEGSLDELALYNYALTGAQVARHYNAQSAATQTLYAPTVAPQPVALTLPLLESPGSSGYVATVLADSPTAYWRLEETSGTNADDSVGSNDGTYVNTPTLGVTSAMPPARAATFTRASSERVSAAAISLGDGPFSYEFWMKRGSLTSQEYGVIGAGAQTNSPIVWIATTGETAYGNDHCLVFSAFGAGGSICASSVAINNTNWHHVVVTKPTVASGQNAKIYLDGVDVTTVPFGTGNATTSTTSSEGFFIGGCRNAETNWFDGSLDEVAVYPSVLSPAQVAAHYAASSAGTLYAPTVIIDQFVTLPTLGSSGYRAAIVADSPVAYWRLGEQSGSNANNEIGTLDGTYVNSPTLGVAGGLSGDGDTAVTFLGSSSQYVTIPDDPSLDITGGSSYEAWYKPTVASDGGNSTIYSKGDLGVQIMCNRVVGGQIEAYVKNGAFTVNSGTRVLADTNWHHIVATVDAGGNWKLYLDGIDVSVVTASYGPVANSSAAAIGRDEYAAGNYARGTIDEVAVYNAVLTPTQVATHHGLGRGLFGPTITQAVASQSITVPLLDAGPAVYAPTTSATVAVPLLTSTSALYAPSVSTRIAVPLLDAVSALYAPSLLAKNLLTVPLLDAVAAVYAPTLVAKNLLTIPALDALPAVYAPAVSTTIAVPALDAVATLYAPTVIPGSVTLTVPALDAGSALYSPTVIPGPAAITLGLLDSNSALYQPTAIRDEFITLGLIDAVSALYAPAIAQAQFLTIPLLDAGPALYSPTLAPQPVTVTVPLLDALRSVSAPSLSATVSLGLIDGGPTLYAPLVAQSQFITLAQLDAAPAVYAPTIIPAPLGVTLPQLDSGPALYAPVAYLDQFVTAPLLDSAPALYTPSLSATVSLGLLDSGSALYAPVAYLDQFVTLGLVDAGPAVFSPSLSVVVALPQLDSGPALYAPVAYLDQFLFAPLLDAGPTVYAPSLSGTVSLGLLDSGSATYAPTLAVGSVTISLALLDAAGAVYTPVLSSVAGGSQSVLLGTIDAGPAVYAPTVLPQPITVSLALLDAVSAVYAPVVIIDQFVMLGLLDAAAAVYAPSLAVGAIGLTLPQLDSGPALYAPVAYLDQFVTVGFLDAGAAVYAPTLAPQPVTVSLGLLDAAPAVYAPNVSVSVTIPFLDSGPALYAPVAYLDQFVTLALIDAGPTVYAPSLLAVGGGSQTVAIGFIDASNAVYAPTLVAQAAVISLGLLDSGSALYAPTTYLDQFVTLGVLDAANALYAPTVIPATAAISLGLIDSGPTVYAPAVTFPTKSVTLSLLDAGPALYAPTLATVVTVTIGLLDAANALYAPAVTFPVKSLTIPALTSVSALYTPTLVQGAAVISLPLLDSGPTLYRPTLEGGVQEDQGPRGGGPYLVIAQPLPPLLVTVNADLYIDYEIRERIAVALSLTSAIRVHAGLELRQDYAIRNLITRELELDHTIVDWLDTNQDVLLAEIDEDLVLLS